MKTVKVEFNHDEIAEAIDALETAVNVTGSLLAVLPGPLIAKSVKDGHAAAIAALAALVTGHAELGDCPQGMDADAPVPFVVTEKGKNP